MKILLLLSLTIASCLGSDWDDFRGGDVALPTRQREAEELNWKCFEEDQVYNVKWFAKDGDRRLSVAFDLNGLLAGVQTTWLVSEVDSDYLQLLLNSKSKGFVEECEVDGQRAIKSTVFFTDKKVLASGGRAESKDNDLVSYITVKLGNTYKRLSREGCVQAKGTFHEQTCQSGYGVVLSSFGSKSTCESLLPFYTVYDPKGHGDLIGFGWIISTKHFKTSSCLKPLSSEVLQKLIPKAPSCLANYPDLVAVEIWFSYKTSLTSSCPEGSWVESNCKTKFFDFDFFHKKKGSDSSSSSSSSESGSSESSEHKESFWKRLFG